MTRYIRIYGNAKGQTAPGTTDSCLTRGGVRGSFLGLFPTLSGESGTSVIDKHLLISMIMDNSLLGIVSSELDGFESPLTPALLGIRREKFVAPSGFEGTQHAREKGR